MGYRCIIERAVSATPLFLFTTGEAINQIARNKHQKIPNHQEEKLAWL